MSDFPIPSGASPSSKALPRGTWAYDGSLEGLFALAGRAFSEGSVPETVANALAPEGELFALLGPAPLSPASAANGASGLAAEAEAASSLLRSFSGPLFDMIIRIWMSEEALELPLFRVCADAGLHGDEVLADYARPDIRALNGTSRRVDREICKLKGLARFSPRADGLYAAPLEPDYNIGAALLPHFARRFGAEDFAIVDMRRHLAFARRGGRYESASGAEALAYLPDPAACRDEETDLWKRYFKATENPARRNPELQRRLMPRRYWRYLPELDTQQ
jgi:uracil-DNA glycosylase